MKKNKEINNFKKNKQALIDKVDAVGGIYQFKEPVKVTVNPFDARLQDKFEPKVLTISGVHTVLGHLGFNCIDGGSVGVCVSDFYDGNQFKVLSDAIQ